MTHLDEELIPQPVSGVDLRSLQGNPSPEDFFILSRVDGAMTVGQLCLGSGLGRQKTLDCLDRLLEFGLIEIPGAQAGSPTKAGAQADGSESQDLAREITSRFPADFASYHFDPELMAQQVEIDDDFKQELLFIYEQLDQVDYYQLLGAARDAPRRELRRAYFQMSKRYHPDRFFRKLLGDFEPPMEAIFQRITTAYQTLSNRDKRQQYDSSLQAESRPATTTASTPEPRDTNVEERRKEMAFQLLYRRGDEALRAGNISEAVQHFRKALTLKREVTLALEITNRLLAWPDHLDEASAFARAAQKLDPQNADAWKTLGLIYEKKGQNEDARYHFERALTLSPQDGETQRALARLEG